MFNETVALTVRCQKCNEGKPLTGFSKKIKNKNGHAAWCKLCTLEYQRLWKEKNRTKVRATNKAWRKRNGDKVRKIQLAWRERNREWVRERSRRYDAKHKDGVSLRGKKYRAKYPERAFQDRLKPFGLTMTQYKEMSSLQGGVCLGCGTPSRRGRLCVDHDHVSGRIRGLLCKDCNIALGLLKDSETTLSNLIRYLANSKENLSSLKLIPKGGAEKSAVLLV